MLIPSQCYGVTLMIENHFKGGLLLLPEVCSEKRTIPFYAQPWRTWRKPMAPWAIRKISSTVWQVRAKTNESLVRILAECSRSPARYLPGYGAGCPGVDYQFSAQWEQEPHYIRRLEQLWVGWIKCSAVISTIRSNLHFIIIVLYVFFYLQQSGYQ